MDLIPTPQEITTLEKVGEYAIKSGFLPGTIKTPQQAVIIALKGKELGIPPLQAFAQISVVNGKPTISAELMLALIYKNIPTAEIQFKQNDDKVSEIHARRNSNQDFAVFKFTIEDAKKAQLLGKDVWQKYPAAMLRARNITAMARALFADAIAGASYTAEELEDIPQKPQEPINVTPTESKETTRPAPEQRVKTEVDIKTTTDVKEPIKTENQVNEFDQIPQPKFESWFPTEKQLARLFAIAQSSGYDSKSASRLLKQKYNIESSKELSHSQYEEFCFYLKNNPINKPEENHHTVK